MGRAGGLPPAAPIWRDQAASPDCSPCYNGRTRAPAPRADRSKESAVHHSPRFHQHPTNAAHPRRAPPATLALLAGVAASLILACAPAAPAPTPAAPAAP